MYGKLAVFTVFLFFVCSGFTITPADGSKSFTGTSGTVLFVGGDGPGNYSSIQGAVDAAVDGDMVFVFNGTYVEHVLVNKQVDLIGEGRDMVIIDGGGTGVIVSIYSSYVRFSGFTVANGGQGLFDKCLVVSDVSDVSVVDCVFTGSTAGIQFNTVCNSSITNCCVHNNSGASIMIYESCSNISITTNKQNRARRTNKRF